MKNFRIKSILFSLMAVAFISIFLTSCEKEEVQKDLVTDYFEGDQLLGNYIEKQDGVYVLTEDDPIKMGIDPDLFIELKEGFNEMNALIESGEIKSEWIGKTVDPETMQIVTIAERGCNNNDVDFHWTSVTVYMSTNAVSWAGIFGCSGLVFAGVWPGIACAVIVQATNQFVCDCGYRANIRYTGSVRWVLCQ